jgi:hypothetical protein
MKMTPQDQNQNWKLFDFCNTCACIATVIASLICMIPGCLPVGFFFLCFTIPMQVVFPALRDLER